MKYTRQLPLLLFVFALHAGDFKTRQEILSNAMASGQLSPCAIATEIQEKYGVLFDSAVKQCKEPTLLEKIPYQHSCSGDCLRILHKHYPHIDMDKPDDQGNTPLHYATHDLTKVRYLVTHGAQVLRKNNVGMTPVDEVRRMLETEAQQLFEDKCSGSYYTSYGIESSSTEPMYKISLSTLASINVLIALQKGTETNILTPLAHPSYEKYIALCLKPPHYHDVIRCDAKQNNYLWDCRKYYALAQMFKQLQKAEQQYFKPSVFLEYFSSNN